MPSALPVLRRLPTAWGVLLAAFAVALGACTDGAPADGSAPPPDAAASPPVAGPAERLSGDVLGTYDTDAQACGETTTMTRLVVSPDTLDFYYGYATVDAVTARDGGYDVGATLYHLEGVEEVVPTPATYRLDPSDDGLRLDADGDVPPVTLVRCAAGGARGEASAGASGSADRDPSAAPAAPAGGDAAGVRSVYTRIADCTTLETDAESASVVQQCPGVAGVPLFVSEGDLRYDVDAGVRNEAFETPSGFNALGPAVEWRVRDGRPFAVIVRYNVDGPDGTAASRTSSLAVIKVGRDGAPGCLVGYVPARATPDQNTAARRLADRDAATFRCGA